MSDRPPSGTRQIDGQEEQDNGKGKGTTTDKNGTTTHRSRTTESGEIERAKTEYALKKANFLDLNITDGFIFISVLQNVEDFYEEGKAMHHCVYSNEYYNRDNSLILSARIDGKRVETIEVNLENLSIIQSRGACNQDTEYHDRIVSLVNKNMKLIRKRMAA